MSEMEHHRGIVKEVKILTTLEDTCKEVMNSTELPSYYDNYIEFLLDEKYKEYVRVEDKLYQVTKMDDIDPDGDIILAEKIEEGVFSFEVRFYNGGCSFSEALEEALEAQIKQKGVDNGEG